METFQLLRLPTVALREVLRCLDPIELYKMSRCSKRVFNTVRLAGTKKFKISIWRQQVEINATYCFYINRWTGTGPENLSVHEIQDYTEELNSITYLCNQFADLTDLFIYLTDLFDCQIYSYWSSGYTPNAEFMSCIRPICLRQSQIPELYINTDFLSEEDVNFIFNNLKVTECLVISAEFSESFRLPCKLSTQSVEIYGSSYITLDDILKMTDTIFLKLSESRLKNEDIELLLHNWMSGNLPNLKDLSISGENITSDFKIRNWPKLEAKTEPEITQEMILDRNKWMIEGVPIERNDGVKGLVRFSDEYDYFGRITLIVL